MKTRKIKAAAEIRTVIKGMKNKKTGDKSNWKLEWIEEGRNQNNAEFSNLVQQNRGGQENSDTMDGNKDKVSLQRRKQREGTENSKRNISDKRSMQSV